MKRVIGLALLCSALAGPALSAPRVETVAVLAPGTAALESLDYAADGSMFMTSNFDNKVMRIDAAGKVLASFTLPFHTQVVLTTPDGGFVVTGHDRVPDFAAARPGQMPSFLNMGTALIVADKTGKVVKRYDGPPDAFFNGITRIAPDTYIIADTIGGSLWKADTAKGTVERWITDASIEGPGGKGSFGGSNGIKAHDGYVYYTSKGALWRVKIGAGNAAEGKPAQYAALGGDDFTIAADGTIYIPDGTKLKAISPAGAVRDIAELGVNCPTAMMARDGKSVFLLTRGGLPGAANAAPSRLLRVWLEG